MVILFVDLASNATAKFLSKHSLHTASAQRSGDEPAAVLLLLPDGAVFLVAVEGLPTPLSFGLLEERTPIPVAQNAILDAVLDELAEVLIDPIKEIMDVLSYWLVRCHASVYLR